MNWVLGLGLVAAGCDTADCDVDCRFERANVAAAAGDSSAMETEIATVTDPLEQDVLRLRLATEHPSLAASMCPAMTTAVGKEKCQQVIGRPHLQGVPGR